MSELTNSDSAREYAESVLVGERVRFRGTREDDLATLVVWQTNPRVLATLTDWVIPVSEAAARERFAEWSANQGNDIGFSVETRPTPDAEPELIGHVGAFGIRPQGRCATLGLLIGPEHARHGYGTDAIRLIISYLFREVGLHRVQATVAAFNVASLYACARAGLIEEGRRREAVFHDGAWYDEVLVSILDEEWLAPPQ
ncbi:RimJ/RimL family protein N-acetyltransferase [Jatrophihabitans sp. GAS493]|uniref:GNAT family N-acetyltransferase n=1 Tax=Jatrophihabitans sp. GAS493 TaxID=1907575 RepID=UPI000BB76810|nr:GNAT family protein [Jatrophihabitans sp. GAS493]SOD72657.1 RimJ/RimL family protein N-acetyltransferase [Jatrophihabitans sp. GAS493]